MTRILVKLLWMRFCGGSRERIRHFTTVRGLVFMMASAGVFVLLFRQMALPENALEDILGNQTARLGKDVDEYMPLAMLATFLLTVFVAPRPALYFNPAEINILFSGPFTRRALVLYKIGSYAFGALLSSLLIAIMLLPSSNYFPPATFLGTFLTLMFIQLLTIGTGLLAQFLTNKPRIKIGAGYWLTIVLVLMVSTSLYFIANADSLAEAFFHFRTSIGGTLILSPFSLFAQIIQVSEPFPGLLQWALLGVGINLLLLVIVIWFDSLTVEASAAESLKLHQRWNQARRSGLLWMSQREVTGSFQSCPVIGGIGPILWRQLLFAIRSSGKALIVFIVMAVMAGPMLNLANVELSQWSIWGGVYFMAVFVLPRTLVFDFRSDLNAIETLKSLPLNPWRIVIGQLSIPIGLSCLIETIFLISVLLCSAAGLNVQLLLLSVLMFPFNLLLYGLENLFFLLLPAPLVPVGRADFDFLGRTLVEFVVKSTILIASCFLAVSVGQAALTATGGSWIVFVAGMFITLSALAVSVLPLLCWIFKRFDVSRGR